MQVRPARDEAEVAAALALREHVFCAEQGVSRAAERDGLDPGALHVVAIEDGRVLGTFRLLFDGDLARLGRMAVERSARGRGVGADMLAEADRQATARGARRIVLHAQERARSVYARAGYQPKGEPFLEEGIDHIAMEKLLA